MQTSGVCVIRGERGENGVRGWGEDLISQYSPFFRITFSQARVCWNNQNTWHPQISIWHLGVLTMQKLINIALEVLKMFKVVKPTIFLMKFYTVMFSYTFLTFLNPNFRSSSEPVNNASQISKSNNLTIQLRGSSSKPLKRKCK